jgi:hypothetical protein
MDLLSASEWMDLGYSALGAVLAVSVCAVILAWKKNKSGKRKFTATYFLELLESALWVISVLIMVALMDLLEKRGWSTLWAMLLPVLIVIPTIAIYGLKRKKALQGAVANPDAAPVRPPAPSKDEVRVNLVFNAVVIAFGVVTIGPILYLAFWADMKGLAVLPYLAAFVVIPFVLLTFTIFGRYPGSISNRAAIEIGAAPQQVWNTVRFRNTTDWWKKIVRSVERTSDPGEWYRVRYFNNDTCGQCCLPRDPASDGRSNLVEILASEEPHRLHFRAYPRGAGGGMENMMDHEDTVLSLEPLEGGRTRVTTVNTAVRPKAWLAFILKIGDPSGEELRTLKGHIEGTTYETIFDVGAKRLDEARHAERFCGCGADAPVAGRFA